MHWCALPTPRDKSQTRRQRPTRPNQRILVLSKVSKTRRATADDHTCTFVKFMKNPIHSVVFAPCLTPIRLSLLLGDADRLLERAATGGPVLLWTLRYLGTFSLRLLDPWPGQGGRHKR